MSALMCFKIDTRGVLQSTLVSSSNYCVDGYLAVHQTDFFTLSSISSLFAQYFSFDIDIFQLVLEANLVAFVVGHGLGRMMMAWRKTF